MVKLPLAAQASIFSQGERESGRAGVLDSTSSTPKHLCRVQRGENSQIRVRSRASVKFSGQAQCRISMPETLMLRRDRPFRMRNQNANYEHSSFVEYLVGG